MKSMRKEYGKTLVELGKKDKNIVALDADLSCSTKTAMFGDEFPDRFFNMGVAEQNMMATAAGLAACGKIPFASTFAMFGAAKCYEVIRNSIAYPKLNVKLVVTHSGISVGGDGSSHQLLEDLSLMRGLPNMRVYVPADAEEVSGMIRHAAKEKGPFYIRLVRPDLESIYDKPSTFSEKADWLKKGDDATVVATGIPVGIALGAAKKLDEAGISTGVLNAHVIKPFDRDAILKAIGIGPIVTIEEHSIYGGLGSCVAEIVAEGGGSGFARIGVEDQFGQSGNWKKLFEYYGLTESAIITKVKSLVKGGKK